MPRTIVASHERTVNGRTVPVSSFEKNVHPEQVAQAVASRHSARSYARSVVKRWPALTEEQRAEVRDILAPVVARVSQDGDR